MSDALATALDDARTRLSTEVENAEAELVHARARARELRRSLAIARELAGIGSGFVQPNGAVQPDAEVDPASPPPELSLRRRGALEGLRRARPPRRERASFAPDVVLHWDDGSPFAGTYRGRKEALALLELVLREVDASVDPAATVRADGDGLRIHATPGMRGPEGLRVPLVAIVRFDDRDRIQELTVTPEAGDALDRLIDAVIG